MEEVGLEAAQETGRRDEQWQLMKKMEWGLISRYIWQPIFQRMLGIGKSKSYMFLEEVYKQKNPPFKVLKIGKLFRVPKRGLMTG